MLRALADVSQEVPYVQSQIQMSPGVNEDEIGTFIREVGTIISMTHVCNIKSFKILFALACEKHGGDPLLFIDQLQYDHAKAAVNQP